MGVPCGQKRQYQGSDKAETAQEVCRGNQLWFSKWKSAITRLTVSQWFTWRYLRELASPQSRQLKLPIRMSYSSSIMKKRQWNLIPLVVLNTLKFEKHCGILLILRTTGVSEEIVFLCFRLWQNITVIRWVYPCTWFAELCQDSSRLTSICLWQAIRTRSSSRFDWWKWSRYKESIHSTSLCCVESNQANLQKKAV